MPAQNSVLAIVQRVDTDPLRSAFRDLSGLSYTRYQRTEQFTAEGTRLAFEERVAESTPTGLRVVAIDSSGAFDFGYLARFASAHEDPVRLTELPQSVLPDDPAYASARNHEAYRYEIVQDTSLHGQPARMIRITARPASGDRQAVRRVHIFLAPTHDQAVGIYLERTDEALWFEEVSMLFMSVRRLGSRYVPYQTRFETRLKLPFRPAQRFRSVFSYYGFGDALS